MSIPIVGRRAKDFLSPFAPSGTFEKLSIVHLEVFDAEDRFWKQYQIDGKADVFGAQWAAFLRAAAVPDAGRRARRRPRPSRRHRSSTSSRRASPRGWPPHPRRCGFRWRRSSSRRSNAPQPLTVTPRRVPETCCGSLDVAVGIDTSPHCHPPANGGR